MVDVSVRIFPALELISCVGTTDVSHWMYLLSVLSYQTCTNKYCTDRFRFYISVYFVSRSFDGVVGHETHRSIPAKRKEVSCFGCKEEKKIDCFRKVFKKNYDGWVCIVCEKKGGCADVSDDEMEVDDSVDEEMEGEKEGTDNFEEKPVGGVGGAHGVVVSRPKRKKMSPTVEVCVCVCVSLSSLKTECHSALVFTVHRW